MKLLLLLKKIKFFLNDVYIIDGKKYSNEGVIAKALARMATLIESIAEEDNEPKSAVEFESADDVIFKLLGKSES